MKHSNLITIANAANYTGQGIRSFWGAHANFCQRELRCLRWGIEIGTPFYENHTGIQMNDGMSLNCGLEYNIL